MRASTSAIWSPRVEHFVPILREQEGCDVVVVVAHSGVEDAVSTDGNNPADYENQVRAMINLTTGIDAVVYGHFHNTDYREDTSMPRARLCPCWRAAAAKAWAS